VSEEEFLARNSPDHHRDAPEYYFRGAGAGAAVSRATVTGLAVGLVVLALTAMGIAMTVAALTSRQRSDELSRNGVDVPATVVGCRGMASGTGITAAGFRCTVRFTIGARTYTEALRGSSALHQPRQLVRAVVDPRDPSSISALVHSRAPSTAWTDFAVAGIPLSAAAASLAFAVGFRRRRTRRSPAPPPLVMGLPSAPAAT
jgi:hypothetical protein